MAFFDFKNESFYLMENKIGKNTAQAFLVLLTGMMVCCLPFSLPAEEEQVISKEVTGQISFVNKDFIAVTYRDEQDKGKEYEMVFYIAGDVILEDIPDLRRLIEEDIVRVEYAETRQEKQTKRMARRIILIKPKLPSLNLKGFRQ